MGSQPADDSALNFGTHNPSPSGRCANAFVQGKLRTQSNPKLIKLTKLIKLIKLPQLLHPVTPYTSCAESALSSNAVAGPMKDSKLVSWPETM